MCYTTNRQNETHHCRPYVGHKTKTPAGWDLLGFSSAFTEQSTAVDYRDYFRPSNHLQM